MWPPLAALRYVGFTVTVGLLAICRPSGCTVVSGVVVVVVVCNRSQMRISKCTCLIFGVSIVLEPNLKCTKGWLLVAFTCRHRHLLRWFTVFW